MKFSKKATRFLIYALVALITMQIPTTVFASESKTILSKDENIQVESIGSNSLSVKSSENEEEIVTLNETDTSRRITITNSTTGKTNYIVYDKSANTVYSSMTGETINLNENKDLNPNANTISPRSRISTYETKYISYAQIKSIVGTTASAAAVVGAILYFVPGAQSIGGAIAAVTTIVSTINNSVSVSNSHGIKLQIKVTKSYRTRLGRKQVYKITRSIDSFGFY